MDAPTASPIVWALEHISVIGWPALCVGIWRVSRFLTKAEVRVINAETALIKMSTNCMPTMQRSLQNQDRLMGEMNNSLKTLAENSERHRETHKR
jgi:hypothetical protein